MISISEKPKEEILASIENQLRKLLIDQQNLKKDFENQLKDKIKENQKLFEENWKISEKIRIKLILFWDFYKREMEIFKLKERMTGMLPIERGEITQKIQELNKKNVELEKVFKTGKVDPLLIREIEKRLSLQKKETEEEIKP